MAEKEPEVKVFRHPASRYDDAYLPQFPAVASIVDEHARRIPWWVWIAVGYGVGSGVLSRLFTKIKS